MLFGTRTTVVDILEDIPKVTSADEGSSAFETKDQDLFKGFADILGFGMGVCDDG